MSRRFGFFQFGRISFFHYFMPAKKKVIHTTKPVGLVVIKDGCKEFDVMSKTNKKVVLIGDEERPNISSS
jgi:hypothetical protein